MLVIYTGLSDHISSAFSLLLVQKNIVLGEYNDYTLSIDWCSWLLQVNRGLKL